MKSLFLWLAVILVTPGCLPKTSVNHSEAPPAAAPAGEIASRTAAEALPAPTPRPTPKSFQGVGF